jgi:hypothetical protein
VFFYCAEESEEYYGRTYLQEGVSMKPAALFLVLALSFPLTAHAADDAAKRAKVQQMLELVHMDRMMDQMMSGIRQQVTAMTNQMVGDKATPEQKAQLEKFQQQMFDFVETRAGWKAMEPDFIELYTQTYTDEELDGIIAFYRTPAGASMIAKTPELTQKALAISQKRVIELVPELQKMTQDFAKTAAKKNPPAIESN